MKKPTMSEFSKITFTMTDVIKLGVFLSVMGSAYYGLKGDIQHINDSHEVFNIRLDRLESQQMVSNKRTEDFEKWRWTTDAILSHKTELKRKRNGTITETE